MHYFLTMKRRSETKFNQLSIRLWWEIDRSSIIYTFLMRIVFLGELWHFFFDNRGFLWLKVLQCRILEGITILYGKCIDFVVERRFLRENWEALWYFIFRQNVEEHFGAFWKKSYIFYNVTITKQLLKNWLNKILFIV